MSDVLVIFWMFVRPSSLILLLLLAGLVLLLCRKVRLAAMLLTTDLVLLLALTFFPIAETAFEALEERFPPIACLPQHVDGIVVLGGSMDMRASNRWQRPVLNQRAERLITAALLARTFPNATLVFSGGPARSDSLKMNESDVARMTFVELGLAPDRAIYEDKSTNTYENAVFSKALAKPQEGSVWLLVTSAYHMPRALALFEAQDWDVAPWPTDHTSPHWGPFATLPDVSGSLAMADATAREWASLVAHYMLGRTTRFLPSARTARAQLACRKDTTS